MKIGIGIDTGGTYTDDTIYDFMTASFRGAGIVSSPRLVFTEPLFRQSVTGLQRFNGAEVGRRAKTEHVSATLPL